MKKKKDKKKNVKYRRKELVERVQRKDCKVFTAKRKEEEKAKKGRKSDKRPKRDKSWGSLVDCALSWCFWNRIGLVSMLQHKDCRKGLRYDATVSNHIQNKMERWQQQRFQAKEGRWVEEIPQRWKQPKGEDRMKKEAKQLRSTLRKVWYFLWY